MRVSMSLQRFKKVPTLDNTAFSQLVHIVKRGGLVYTDNKDEYAILRKYGFVRMKAGKAWVTFEVNGSKPSPFVGHSKKTFSEPKRIAGLFFSIFREFTGRDYGGFTSAEWGVLTKLSKEYDRHELSEMFRWFFTKYAGMQDPSLLFMFKNKASIFREVKDAGCIKARSGPSAESDDEW